MGVSAVHGRCVTVGGSELGIIPRVFRVSGIVTSVWRCQEGAGHI